MSDETRVYELGYLLVPHITEGALVQKKDSFAALLTKHGGEVIFQSNPEYIDLAYPMHIKVRSEYTTFTQAYFGSIQFKITPDILDEVKKALTSDTDLIRYILVKTSEKNTVVFKKPKQEPKRDILEELQVTEEEMQEEEDVVVAPHEALPQLDISTEEAQ